MMSGTIKIELSGPMGCGKSTIARIIEKALKDAGARSVAFEKNRHGECAPKYNVTDAIMDKRLADRPDRAILICEKVDQT